MALQITKTDTADDGRMLFSILTVYVSCIVGRDSSVCIATLYGDQIPVGVRFSPLAQTSLEPTQPPIQWVPGLSRR